MIRAQPNHLLPGELRAIYQQLARSQDPNVARAAKTRIETLDRAVKREAPQQPPVTIDGELMP